MVRPRQYFMLFLLMVALGGPVSAQAPVREEKNPTQGLAMGLFAHTYGFGIDVRYLIRRDNFDWVIGTTLGSLKHPQELKIESAYVDQGGKDYIYDKKNYAYVLAPTLSISKNIIPKTGFNKISLSGSFGVGPTVALLKPYYVEVAIPFSGNQAYVDTDKYDASKYNYTNIVGEADYFLGMEEITAVPGIRAKCGALVDFSAGKEYIRGVELSAYADYFFTEPELLDLTANKQVFIGGAVSLLIGNMW